MTVESPYQRRTGEDPDALDPTAAGYPVSEAEPEERSDAEPGADDETDRAAQQETGYETEHDDEHDAEHDDEHDAEHEENGAPAGGAWPGLLNTGAEPSEQTDEDDEAEDDDEAEPAESAAPEASAFEESEPEESASDEVASDEATPEEAEPEAALEPAAPEAVPYEAVEEEGPVPSEAVLEEEALGATEPWAEPAVGEAVGSGSLIGAEPTPAFSPHAAAAATDTIISAEQASVFTTRLRDIQVAFIDEPHKAAEDADRLLGEVAREFAAGVEAQRGALGSGSDDADAPQTEQLRIALQRYRRLIDVLLSC